MKGQAIIFWRLKARDAHIYKKEADVNCLQKNEVLQT